MAVRIDNFSEIQNNIFGKAFKNQIENRLEDLKNNKSNDDFK